MRIKKVNWNWNASSIIKRDRRHTHSDEVINVKKKKNTRKWCHGKIGKAHNIVRTVYSYNPRVDYYWGNRIEAQCTNCKRRFYGKRVTNNRDYPLHIKVDWHGGSYEVGVRHDKS